MSGIPSKVSTGAGISLGADGFSTSSGTFNAGTTPPTNGAVNVDAATYGGTFLSAVNTSGSSITMSVDATTNTLTVNGNVVVTGTVAEAAVSEGPLTITGGTVTTNTPFLQATQSWNAGGVTFTGLKVNITDTASAAGSLLMDYQVGGATKFSVTKAGTVSIATGATYQVNGTTVLSATALGSTVVSSSLTSIGTLASGAVPASLVTAGTFGAGNFTFAGTISGVTTLSTSGPGLIYAGAVPVDSSVVSAYVAGYNGFGAKVSNNSYFNFSGSNASGTRTFFVNGYGVVSASAGDFGATGAAIQTGDIIVSRAATTGVVYFGSTSNYLYYNAGTFQLTGNLAAGTDATYDIGASGATRFRDFYLSRNATIGGTLGVTGAATFSSTVQIGTVSTLSQSGNSIYASRNMEWNLTYSAGIVNNKDIGFSFVDNTHVRLYMKGSDGTVRSVDFTVA